MNQPPLNGILLRVAYDGTGFHGFVPQAGAETVGGALLAAIQHIDPAVSEIRVVSRTDAGVHARGQIVAFDSVRSISARGWVLGLSRLLPSQVAPRWAAFVPPRFEPRRHVVSKLYRYRLLCDPRRDPLVDRYAWHIHGPIDFQLAQQQAIIAVGTHDFAAFRSSADTRANTQRTIFNLTIESSPDRRHVCIDVRGDGFMHNMVRILVGTLVDIAQRRRPHAIERALESLRREDLGVTAPAKGLSLERVELDPNIELMDPWPDAFASDETIHGPQSVMPWASPELQPVPSDGKAD